jgi:hypothetical protein
MENPIKGRLEMKEAFQFYGDVHRKYLWLHVIFSLVLVMTSVFWFVLPFYIVNYGNYEPTFMLNVACGIFLCVFPSFVITLHCWFISFEAAKSWIMRKEGESLLRWFMRFQAMAFLVVIGFTSIIYLLFLVIDIVR